MSFWASQRIRHLAWVPLVLLPLVGVVLVFYPTISSGFEVMQTGVNDVVYNHLTIEHTWCWISGPCWDYGFWNPPFGYPLPNLKATSDTLLSFAPVYWVLRLLGVNMWTSFSLWMMAMFLLNYAVFYAFLRRCFDVSVLGSVVGALFFAFASPRTAQLGHPQLQPHVFIILVLWGLIRVLDEDASPRRRTVWLYVAALALVAQLAGAVYNFEFICFALLLCLPWVLVFGESRRRVWRALKLLWLHVLAAATIAFALGYPVVSHYLTAKEAFDGWDFATGVAALPRLESWVHVGPHSWLYGWMSSQHPFTKIPAIHEHSVGVGFVTTVVAALGLLAGRRRWAVRFLVLGALSTMALLTLYPGHVSAWPYLFRFVPGMESIRIPVRIGMLLLLPLAVGVGHWAASRRKQWWRLALALVLAAVCCMEQVGSTTHMKVYPRYSRVADLLNRLDRNASVFVVFPPDGHPPNAHTEMPAMWASLYSGIPTINLCAAAVPGTWPLKRFYFHIGRPQAYNYDLYKAVMKWANLQRLDTSRMWILEQQGTGEVKAQRALDYKPPFRQRGPKWDVPK